MINFRFHVVSLVAVFLALAVGIVVGSTVVDRAIVDGLESQIDRVERNAEGQRRENAELREQLDEFAAFAEESAAVAVQGRIAEVPVVVLAVRGVDEEIVQATVEMLRAGGGVVPAILWLEPQWSMDEAEHRASLRAIVGRSVASADELREIAAGQLAHRLAEGAPIAAGTDASGAGGGSPAAGRPASRAAQESTSTTTGVEPDASTTTIPGSVGGDILTAFVGGGFIGIDTAGADEVDLSTYPGPGARVVVVDGPEARVPAETLSLPVIRALTEFPLLVLAVDIPESGDDADRAVVAGQIRSDDDLVSRVSTVDHADAATGQVAAVLALEELGRGNVGHYGTGPGVSRQLPEPARGTR